MPLFKKENDYYNSYTDDALFFKEIGAYTIEDYKRDTKAQLKEQYKQLQEEIIQAKERAKQTKEKIKLAKEKESSAP